MKIQGGETQGKCSQVNTAERAASQAGSQFQGCSQEELGEGGISDWPGLTAEARAWERLQEE